MTEPTGFISNKPPYVNRDLNTIFAPISQLDYGSFTLDLIDDPTDPNPIAEAWSRFNAINADPNSVGNVSILNFNGFYIQNPGIYKLSMSLIFGLPETENVQQMYVILNSANDLIVGDSYDFTPYPQLTDIFSISGLSVAGNGTGTNQNNDVNVANQLAANSTGPAYMFTFQLVGANTNIATFEITFNVPGISTVLPTIYPQIRCQQSSANPSTTLTGGRWLFSKLN